MIKKISQVDFYFVIFIITHLKEIMSGFPWPALLFLKLYNFCDALFNRLSTFFSSRVLSSAYRKKFNE